MHSSREFVTGGQTGYLPSWAAVENAACQLDCRQASEWQRLVRLQLYQFLQQTGIGHGLALAEIDQRPGGTIALGEPAVLVGQGIGIDAPALVLLAQPQQGGKQTAVQRGDRKSTRLNSSH